MEPSEPEDERCGEALVKLEALPTCVGPSYLPTEFELAHERDVGSVEQEKRWTQRFQSQKAIVISHDPLEKKLRNALTFREKL